ncbi:hypothetical protein PspLS_03480 [Pyricularia sp. CBS 133598]|nr:hypothetical protein PspLS_03480 [Pyricularia sp. CBS 133598]
MSGRELKLATTLGHRRCNGGAQAVAKDNDARGRNSDGIQHVVHDGHAVNEHAGFGRRAGGFAEAAVVYGYQNRTQGLRGHTADDNPSFWVILENAKGVGSGKIIAATTRTLQENILIPGVGT